MQIRTPPTATGRALVFINAVILGSETSQGRMSYAASGGVTVAASDARSIFSSLDITALGGGFLGLIENITPGSVVTITAKYRKEGPGADPQFRDRHILAVPL